MELIFCLLKNGEIYGQSNNTKIDIEEVLNKKIKFICSFCNTTIIIEVQKQYTGLMLLMKNSQNYIKEIAFLILIMKQAYIQKNQIIKY